MGKTIIGRVVSKKTDKTIVVSEQVRATHPLYRKQYTITKRFKAHDESNEAGEGDRVLIAETRPLSKQKRFKLEKVLEKAQVRHVETEDEAVSEVTGQKKTKEDEQPQESGKANDSKEKAS